MKRILNKEQHSMARAKAIRGQISSPIPITDHMDEAVILPTVTLHREPTVQQITVQSPGESTHVLHNGVQIPSEEVSGPSVDADAAWPAPVLRSTQRSVYTTSTARNSEIDPAADVSGSGDQKGHRRQKSGFKGAIEKLFGKSSKKKTASTSTAPQPATKTVSITGYDNDHAKKQNNTRDGARATSLPIEDLDRALRSHSVNPEDVLAIESARNSVSNEYSRPRKRATTVSSTYSRASRYVDEAKVGGLSPRPASPQEQTSAVATAPVEDPEEIGKAITSDSKTLKRRSRSMSAIPYLQSPLGERRRRSDEARYRRTTPQYNADAMPPMSPNTSEEAALRAFSLNLPPSTPTSTVVPQTPTEQFNFGDLGGTRPLTVPLSPPPPPPSAAPPLPTLVEPKQPAALEPQQLDAAQEQSETVEETSTLDARVDNVEKRLWKLEDTVSEMQSFPPEEQDEAPTPRPRDVTNPPVSSTTPGLTSILKQSQVQANPQPGNNEAIITLNQYKSLLHQLDAERTARQALETYVEQLSRQLQAMVNYPRPPTYRRSIETYRLLSATPVTQTSVFDEDDEDDESNDLGNVDYKKSLRESFVVHGHAIVPPELDDSSSSSSSNEEPVVTTREGHRTFGTFDQQAPRVMALMSPTKDTMG